MKTISIYDNDLNNYLVENKPQNTAFEDFLHFRDEQFLGEWWEDNQEIAPIFDKMVNAITDEEFTKMYNHLFYLWVAETVTTEQGIEFVKEEISACNFTIEYN